jgi:hypothetical protein
VPGVRARQTPYRAYVVVCDGVATLMVLLVEIDRDTETSIPNVASTPATITPDLKVALAETVSDTVPVLVDWNVDVAVRDVKFVF